MSQSILVTGGTGLVGAHLLHLLHSQGIKAKAIYRNNIPASVKEKAEWIQTDLLDIDGMAMAMKGVTQVYHAAGFVSFYAADKKQLHAINVQGTANVVNAALDAGVQKLVHVSSVAALGRIRKNTVIDESMQWSAETSNSEYAKTKFLAEMEVWRGQAEGLQVAMVNPTIILGEHGNWSSGSMKIFQSIAEGFKYYSLGETGFVDANDVAAAMVVLMNSGITGERYVVSGENMLYRDLFFLIADGLEVQRPHVAVTPQLAAIAWRLEKLKSFFTGKKPLITKETAATGLASVKFSNQKLLKTFPDFRFTPLQKTVERICRHYKPTT